MAKRRRRAPATKRNPSRAWATPKTAAERREYRGALAAAAQIHGNPDRAVVALSPRERMLPKYLAVLGRAPAIPYDVSRAGSKRRGKWLHTSGDAGGSLRPTGRKPLIAVGRGKRPVIIPMGSGMRVSKGWLVK